MSWKLRLRARLQQQQHLHLWRKRVTMDSAQGPMIVIEGRQYLNFASNDYLGLANHRSVVAQTKVALESAGAGSGASHLICGHHRLHQQLEEKLAEFTMSQRVLLFSTGYMANLALPQTFLRRGDLLVQDRLNHASLIDAARINSVTFKRYAHGNMSQVERLLQDESFSAKMLMTDGVFSMDGDIAPLDQLAQICDRHDTLWVVDDAHGVGVLGDQGRGSLEQFGLVPRGQLLMMGTLGKGFGSYGAFVAGDAEFIEALIQFARPYTYTTALPPHVAAASLAAVEFVQQHPELRIQLQQNIMLFRQLAISAGIPLMDSLTPIQPIMIGTGKNAESIQPVPRSDHDGNDQEISRVMRVSQSLQAAGYWVVAIRPPTVPKGTSRLRITINAGHTKKDLEGLVTALASALR